MSIVSAEITKIAINSYITTKISFANMLGNICEQIEGAEIDKITEAMGKDKRISPYYLKYGTAYGGPCFPRDNRAFSHFAKSVGTDALIPLATHRTNEFQTKFLADKILKTVNKYKINDISILGLSYKPGAYIIEESASINLIKQLLKQNKNLKIVVYDPIDINIKETQKIFKDKLNYANNLNEALSSKLIVIMTPVIMNPDKEFKGKIKDKILIDCWRIIKT